MSKIISILTSVFLGIVMFASSAFATPLYFTFTGPMLNDGMFHFSKGPNFDSVYQIVMIDFATGAPYSPEPADPSYSPYTTYDAEYVAGTWSTGPIKGSLEMLNCEVAGHLGNYLYLGPYSFTGEKYPCQPGFGGRFEIGKDFLGSDGIFYEITRIDTGYPVPEPSTLILLVAGLGGMVVWGRKKGRLLLVQNQVNKALNKDKY